MFQFIYYINIKQFQAIKTYSRLTLNLSQHAKEYVGTTLTKASLSSKKSKMFHPQRSFIANNLLPDKRSSSKGEKTRGGRAQGKRDSKISSVQSILLSANCRAKDNTSSKPSTLVPEACAEVSRPPPLPSSFPDTAWIHSFALSPFSATTACKQEQCKMEACEEGSKFERQVP